MVFFQVTMCPANVMASVANQGRESESWAVMLGPIGSPELPFGLATEGRPWSSVAGGTILHRLPSLLPPQ